MPRPKGTPKTGGRKPKDKAFDDLLKRAVAEMKDPPERVLSRIADGDLPCGTCAGKGRTKYQSHTETPGERTCQSCYGSGRERVTTDQRARAAAELLKYIRPQLKAIELRNPDGETLRTTVDVIYHSTDAQG